MTATIGVQQGGTGGSDAGAAAGQREVITVGPDGRIIVRDGNESVTLEPGTVPPWLVEGPPAGVFMVPVALFASIAFVIVGLPIARAFARRMDRKGATTSGGGAEMRQLQTSLDAMAVEVERISESQRFLTRLMAEGRAPETLAAGATPGDAARRP